MEILITIDPLQVVSDDLVRVRRSTNSVSLFDTMKNSCFSILKKPNCISQVKILGIN